MKLYFFLILTAVGQQSGDIFGTIQSPTIVSSDPSESSESQSIDTSGAPLPDFSASIETGSNEISPRPTKDPEGEKSTVPFGDIQPQSAATSPDTKTESLQSDPKQALIVQNQQILQQSLSLEQEFQNSLALLNQYRILEAQRLEQYTKEMQQLAEYNEKIINFPENAQEIESQNMVSEPTNINNDDDENDDEEKETSLAIIVVLGAGFLFLVIHSLRGIWISYCPELSKAGYTLLVDSTILVMLWCVIGIFNYFEKTAIEVSLMLVGLGFFSFFWVLCGVWLIFMSYLQGKTWNKYEKLSGVPTNWTPALQKYIVMRQLFISPVYIAPVTESQLSPNFDFSNYLLRSLGEVIHYNYHITWVGYSFVIISLVIWRVFAIDSHIGEMVILWCTPCVILLILLMVLLKLYLVLLKLVPQKINTEFVVAKAKHLAVEEARTCIPRPKYLQGKIEENVEKSLVFCKVNPFKLTCAYLFLSRYPNRHELLLWFDSYGPTFLGIIAQVLVMLLNFWVTSVLLFYIPEYIDETNGRDLYFMIGALLVWTFTSFYLVPSLFIHICLTTKIEMMKDRKIIEEVITENRKNTIAKTIKIYRQLKMIYREIKGKEDGEETGEILSQMKKIAEEVFLLVSTNRKTIHVTEIDQVLSLIGIRLQEDELRLFAKECLPDKNNFVGLKGFKMAIERILYGYEMHPHEVVAYILRNFFKKKEKITVNDLNDFFNEWTWHFNEDDLREFLQETQSLEAEHGYFKLDEIATLVRINVEGCPK